VAKLEPFVGMTLHIGSARFEFMPHPLFPGDNDAVYVIEGGEALVYQVRNAMTGSLFALKVIKAGYHGEHIARVLEILQQQADIPGLYILRRLCLTQERFSPVIEAFPELEYATLTPWLEGKTWAGVLLDPVVSSQYTQERACRLAFALARLFNQLETRRMAHTDIAGGNVLFSQDMLKVQLIDIEGVYVQGLPRPNLVSHGSPGYQHRNPGPQGLWCPEGDRFAGAVLITEVLVWWNPRLRAMVSEYAESLFRPEEVQAMGHPIWQEVRNTLWSMRPPLLHLFDQAWASATLLECPDFATWSNTLSSFFM